MSENAPELTAELIVDSAVPRSPVISPDGVWVAYVVASIGRSRRPVSALWVAAADGSSPPRELTSGTACEGVPRWAPDSASIFFRSDRQLHRIRLDSSESEALTTWRGGIVDHWPLADGEVVALIAADEPSQEDERRQTERDDAMVWGERVPCSRLRLFDLGTHELRVVDGLGDRHVVEVVQRPDGGPLAVISWACPEIDPGTFTAELHVVDPGTGAVHDLGRIELEACSPAWWSVHDAWRVAYLAMPPPASVDGFAVFDVTVPAAGAAGEHRNLTAGMTVCPTHLVQVADGAPLALFADGLDTAIYRLDPGLQRFRHVSTRDGRVDSLTVSRSGEVVAALASTAYEPKDVHAGPPGGRLVRLSDIRPNLRRIRWGTQERLSYKAGDGLDLDGLLILPAGKRRQDGPFPLITLVHGGPYDRHADEFNAGSFPPGQWLATAGYAVFLPNPRGGQGHGYEFAAAVAGKVGLDEWTDIVSGIDLLIADGVADPDRLGIGGWSHGGFMAAWAIGQTDRFKAALMGAGISDWGMQAATGELGALEAGLSGSRGWEGPGPHRHDQLSPISFASKVRTPVLILHGENDTNVPLGQATFFHRALCHFGVEHEFVVYPREGHSIRERNHQLDLLRRTREWFDRWLGDPASDQDRI
ncbi:dipeptidyl aminopeptidase/acylaminoacyl peptidase [Streptosporangium album]|uniref:Dipeptidyl aminopeptidase/acylaminoacyl peptidase n=1 Tax=Streptosporangium album TaxID=47479 RepID=A0A7W7RR73_9ACTN|nr:prolyl oligopeptidase family serine peptidase [Streptosporangium album]MBB4936648.1 dipeptidyl aminopeptidase/acylaminoacyl peptidase [Streptosporangium album]